MEQKTIRRIIVGILISVLVMAAVLAVLVIFAEMPIWLGIVCLVMFVFTLMVTIGQRFRLVETQRSTEIPRDEKNPEITRNDAME